jgi:hypothetical protein
MRMSVAALRDVAAEQRAKEKAEAPTVKTEEQMKADEAAKERAAARKAEEKHEASKSIWRRKFRPLPEAKAVDLFADVIGDSFILGIAGALIIYEYVKSKQKPDTNAVKLGELEERLKMGEKRVEELEEIEKRQLERVELLEEALEALRSQPARKRFLSIS